VGHLYKNIYKRNIVIAAADTVRAAAVDQLQIWGERNEIPVITRSSGTDQKKPATAATITSTTKAIRQVYEKVAPDMVVHDAFQYITQQSKNNPETAPNLLIVDTAGRLQTNMVSMDELQKIYNACSKARRGAPDYVWLVLDATIGQNSIEQAKEFSKRVRVNGIIMTKLDGSARGGVILGIAHNLKIPILYLGVGEKSEDIREFDAETFVDSILNNNDIEQQQQQQQQQEE
jgi:fused signal recognition particle receptor